MKFNNATYGAKLKKSMLSRYIAGMVLVFSISSCVNMRKSAYFYETPDSTFISSRMENLEPVLKSNDLLGITVSSVNPDAAALFNPTRNATMESSTATGEIARASGYLIDEDGFIRFPILGKIMAAGKTKKALREEITNALETGKLLIEPIVDIRYLNFKVSVLGEVRNPSVMTIPNEKISLLEALGLAGDITIYGNKQNVTLIREEDGKKTLRRIDLTSNEIFSSPYYHLKSNDIIYVEPKESKALESSIVKAWIPVALSAISLAIITIVNFK
ncbi:polysaccharide biosynthesis/export family protein [Zobellia nedashkovskayae]|uniref:polysaccharide biosynthesis/export family protein n=1 Tax=Zobellia nedashkovskayae TaxID=2779510 RepID=UPI001D0590F0|nr:polysaccharide biosynthesis/export family protein [Zobellia nedashkovskayae]